MEMRQPDPPPEKVIKSGARAIGLRPRLRERRRLATVDHRHAPDMWLEQPLDRRSPLRGFDRNLVGAAKAGSELRQRLQPRRHPTGSAYLPLLADRHLTEVAVSV